MFTITPVRRFGAIGGLGSRGALRYMALHIVIGGRRTTLLRAAVRHRAGRFFVGIRPLRAKTGEDRKLLELLEPVAESQGLEIVRLRLR